MQKLKVIDLHFKVATCTAIICFQLLTNMHGRIKTHIITNAPTTQYCLTLFKLTNKNSIETIDADK